MNKILKRLITMVILSSSICILPLIGANAEWRKDDKGWWYSQGNSYEKDCWFQDKDGKWYYFDNNGYMVVNTTVNGYRIDNNGVWIQNTTVNNVSNTNNNNINNVNNNINNGQIINSNTNIYVNNTTTNNINDTFDTNETTENDKDYDGTDGFKNLGNDEYVYYDDGEMLVNTWKKFKEGYRHFNEDGYMDFGNTIDGLSIDENGVCDIPNSYKNNNGVKKYLFTTLQPYYESTIGISGDIDYIEDTFDTFGVKYDIEFVNVYNSNEDGELISIKDNFGDHFSEMTDDNFDAEKIIQVGKYSSRVNLD